MSKIKNGGLDQYGAEPFEQQQFGTAGVEGVKYVSLCRMELSCKFGVQPSKHIHKSYKKFIHPRSSRIRFHGYFCRSHRARDSKNAVNIAIRLCWSLEVRPLAARFFIIFFADFEVTK